MTSEKPRHPDMLNGHYLILSSFKLGSPEENFLMTAVSSRPSYSLLGENHTLRSKEKVFKICLALIGLFYVVRVEKLNNDMKTLRNVDYDPSHIGGRSVMPVPEPVGEEDGEEEQQEMEEEMVEVESDEPKVMTDDIWSQWHSSYPERIIPAQHRRKAKDIRYAAFGSSMTWGATLDDREKDAYISKLSLDKGTNYGIRSSGPNYPAACTHSLLGDEEYDVFVLEFFTVANTGMMELAQRLRERFPDAIIVIARLWDPPMLENKDGQGMRSWAHEHGFGADFIHKPEFKEAFLREYPQNRWHWIFQTTHKWFVDVHEEVAKQTGAYIVPMAWDEHAAGAEGFLEIGDKMLGPDSFHLSKRGHEDFANRVKALVNRVGVPKKPNMGQFSTTDYCLNWFQTGEIGEGLEYSGNARVGKMPNTEKYALTFDGNSQEMESGWIEMTNPSDETMYMFVAYMTTGPAPSKYPKTEAARDDGDQTKKMLEPLAEWGAEQKMKVHVSRLVNLGAVKPHATAKVNFRPVEVTEWPFRMVQVVLTGKADFGDSFGAMPDSGRIRGTIDE